VTTSAFVTGGSGFIGGALVRRLVADGWTVRADGEPVVFRDFVTRLIETQGVTPPDRSLPAPLANAVATVGETAWRLLPLPGRPPLTRLAVWLSAVETTIDITRARTELGYAPVRTIDDGLEELRQP
jgi:nucleoside-diphosphate-sugar epimerase